MHDPMVVAWEIPSPLPHRVTWRERGGRRWGFDVARFTNPEHLGQRIYGWWRPKGYTLRLAGRAYGLGRLATVWHVEPGGRDSGEVCKHYDRWKDDDGKWKSEPRRAWRWHVHHWKIQIPALQSLRRRLFDRCTVCKRKGSPNVSHQWDSPGLGWRKWRSKEGLYHSECSSLVSLRTQREDDALLIRHLAAAFSLHLDISEEEAVNRLSDGLQANHRADGFRLGRRLAQAHGMEMQHGTARWVRAEGRERAWDGLVK